MVSFSVTVIKTTIIVTFCLVTATEQHWKWHKPYAVDGPPKYLHSAVYKPKSLPPKPLYAPVRDKPYAPVRDKPYAPAHEKPYAPAHEKHQPHAHEKLYSPGHEKSSKQDHCELRKVIFTQDAESPQVRGPRVLGCLCLFHRLIHKLFGRANTSTEGINGYCVFFSTSSTNQKCPTWRNSRCVIGTTFSTTRTIILYSRTLVSMIRLVFGIKPWRWFRFLLYLQCIYINALFEIQKGENPNRKVYACICVLIKFAKLYSVTIMNIV